MGSDVRVSDEHTSARREIQPPPQFFTKIYILPPACRQAYHKPTYHHTTCPWLTQSPRPSTAACHPGAGTSPQRTGYAPP